MSHDLVELARRYVECSNAHDVDLIRPLLAAHASYRSAYVGEHRSREPILAMMSAFFARYPDVSWEVHRLEPVVAEHAVALEFVMRATDSGTGERIQRQDTERIFFGRDGAIVRIEVGT